MKKSVFMFLWWMVFKAPTTHQFKYINAKGRLLILEWNNVTLFENIPTDREVSCESYKCLVSSNQKHLNDSDLGVILFVISSHDILNWPLPRGNKTWAAHHDESWIAKSWFIFMESQSLLNVTATFSRYSEYPVIFDGVIDIGHIITTQYYVPLAVKNKLKLAPILYMQQSCDNPTERDAFVLELMKYIDIDSYRPCLNNRPMPDELTLLDKTPHNDQVDLFKFIAMYKFVITIENAICDDYISEKIWKPIISGSVPIYLGSPSIKDWLPNPNSAIIITDYLTIQVLARYIYSVNNNDTLYLQHMQHKLSLVEKVSNKELKNALLGYSMNTAKYDGFVCFLCKNAHDKIHYKKSLLSIASCIQPKHEEWIDVYTAGRCKAKVLDELINKQSVSNMSGFYAKVEEFKYLHRC